MIVSSSYPDYALMRLRLPTRSLAALKHRAAKLGIVRRRHVWGHLEVRKLSNLVIAGASNAELARALPHLRPGQILAKIRHLGLQCRKPRLTRFDDQVMNEVRGRAIEKGLSLRDLDRSAGTGRYFQSSTRRLVLGHVARAIRILGGDIHIEWDDV